MVSAVDLLNEKHLRVLPDDGAPSRPAPLRTLSKRERKVAVALAEAAMPAGKRFPSAGESSVPELENWLSGIDGTIASAFRASLVALDVSTLPTHRKTFSALSLDARMGILERWEQSRSARKRALLRGILTPFKFAHYSRPEMYAHVGCRSERAPARDESARWMGQVTDGREIEEDLDLECEVVVIGTGAGGAAVAYELARRGRAVLLLEEGDYHRRSSFDGKPASAYQKLYRDQALMMSVGNVGIPLWAGRAVGGSTVINSGTCYRAPERTFAYWRSRFGLSSEFSSEGMAPYYERVEQMLEVAPANMLHVGTIGSIIAKGADHLKLTHGALPRNAPGCDGQGVCCFGCPTGAKRSTDVSYVPEALKRGAQLVTAARVDSIDVVAGRARGVTASLGPVRDGKKQPKLRVRAENVVVACGTLLTPLLLRRSGVVKSKMLGKNLSLHPASKVFALFDERVDQWNGIPQSYTIDHFAEIGLMFEGGSLPLDVAALGFGWTGHRLTEVMEQYPHLATFGFIIQDRSRGEVREGLHGSPLIRYSMNDMDVARMKHAMEVLCEVYLAAGARRVLPLIAGFDEVNSKADLERLRASTFEAGDFEVTAFHPLGTCRIGMDPERSCLGPDQQARDVSGLYVCDGSAVPSSLGVNPQMTIMAMSLRAAELIDSRLG